LENILLVGAGGHCKVVLSILMKNHEFSVFGISDENKDLHGRYLLGYEIRYSEKDWEWVRGKCSNAFVAFGNIDIPYQRKEIYKKLLKSGFSMPVLRSNQSIIADDVIIGEGTVIMPGAIINTGSSIGKNCIINTGSIIDHDCTIGNHTHIAPGVTCSGGLTVGDLCHIGTGATIIQSITIGSESLVASGAVVVRDVPKASRVKGIPARRF